MITVIIPTYRVKLNDLIVQMESLVKQEEKCELIFSDGESNRFFSFLPHITPMLNNTSIQLKVIQNPNTHTVLTRSQSMNIAAKEAHGDILLFLHIDTILPANGLKMISERMNNEDFVGGGFLKHYDKSFVCRITEKVLNYRTSNFKEMVGSNAMFLRTSVFSEDPFSEQFMEDVVYSDFLLKKYTKKRIVIINDYVIVSSVKYTEYGVLKRILINSLVMFLYRYNHLGSDELEKLYQTSQNTSIWQICKRVYQLMKSRSSNKDKELGQF